MLFLRNRAPVIPAAVPYDLALISNRIYTLHVRVVIYSELISGVNQL